MVALVERGDIYYANLEPVQGSEQGGMRPVLIIQNDVGNQHSPTTIIASITTKIKKAQMPTHVEIKASENGLQFDSVIMLEQIRTIDKQRLEDKITTIDLVTLQAVDDALAVSIHLTDTFTHS